MSASVVTVTIDSIETTQNKLHAYGTFAVGAGDYAADGLAVNLESAALPVSNPPIFMDILSQPLVADAATGQYVYGWLKGSDLSDGQLQVFTGAAANSPLTELATAATPAAVVADRIVFHAVFERI